MSPHRMVYIVDDDVSLRKSLARLLATHGYRTTAFADPQQFLREVRDEGPACALVDMKMPGLDGLEVQKRLMKTAITLPIVFITGHGTIPMTVRAIQDGAVDFLEKPFEEEALLGAIEKALLLHVERLADKEDRERFAKGYARLSERETQVLELIVKGFINREIADLLGISEKTVKNHRASVMSKMAVDSLVELVQLCLAQTMEEESK